MFPFVPESVISDNQPTTENPIMDAFEVRMQFLRMLKKLNATQLSIQQIVGYAMKYFSKCGEDIWECLVEECQKGTLNTRINILYLLDNLCETSLHYQAAAASSGGSSSRYPGAVSTRSQPPSYIEYVTRDLDKIVQLVVPPTREGLMNLGSTRQILESWRTRRILDPAAIDDLLRMLDERKQSLESATSVPDSNTSTQFSRDDIFRRIEEDRERHKILRQKRWHLPAGPQSAVTSNVTHTARLAGSLINATSPISPSSPGQHQMKAQQQPPASDFPVDVEFENAWETTSDWNEDDEDVAIQENELCFPPIPPSPMPLVQAFEVNDVDGGHFDPQGEGNYYASRARGPPSDHRWSHAMDTS